MPRRLPFRIPEYAPRITWASVEAREVWAPRIAAVSQAFIKNEQASVLNGVRPSALQNVSPDTLPALMQELAPKGVIVLPLGKSPRANGYQSASRALKDSEPWDYRVAITRPEHAAAWAQAWAASDDDAIGRLLGTPKCCRQFFDRVWKTERWFDTTWPMYRGQSDGFSQSVSGFHANLLWRWLGVRPVSHLPCSPNCAESLALSKRLSMLLPEPERTWMREILSWPVKWTALHGIAEVTTPILRMSVATDATAERLEVRYLGTGYPEEGAKGVDFPHISGPAKAVPLTLTRRPDSRDNGFETREAMDAAHRRLLDVLPPGPFGTVLDLGCGDGTLLAKIPARRRVGVESVPARARHARTLDRVIEGDCTEATLVQRVLSEERPDLIIAQAARNPLHTLSGFRVLSYSYEAGAAPPVLVNP